MELDAGESDRAYCAELPRRLFEGDGPVSVTVGQRLGFELDEVRAGVNLEVG